ncbi:MAG: glycosyltransferase family 4 protein [Oscillospiraceae bacterium]|nr:glycosyltransferase family 4 protein [Oscillospiraceae bacterium]
MGYKVLMALNRLDIGGAETHVAELSLELQRRGWEVILASNGGAYVPKLEAAGMRHFQVPMSRRSWGDIHASQKQMEQIIREEKPDIVHAHARIPGYVCGRVQSKLDFPFVTTAHWVFHTNFLLNRITNWGQRTIAVSEDIKSYLIENYGVPAEHITVTINGIDTSTFSPETSAEPLAQELGLDLSRPVLGTVSRLDPDRSQAAKLLLELAPRLAHEIPGIQLLVVGGGGDYPEMQRKADELNRAAGKPYVYMTGPRTDIKRAVAACDGFVGVSRAALEAMSAAKPVILAGNEGYQGIFTADKLEEARGSNFCCREAPAMEQETLCRDVLALLRMSDGERRALGDFGRQVIQAEYSVSRMADDCERVYRSVLQQ